MSLRRALLIAGLLGGLAGLTMGCLDASTFLNSNFMNSVLGAETVATVPGEAPGLLVSVENRTDRLASLTVSYRDSDSAVVTYTVELAPGNKSGQVLACPVSEITLGSVSDLSVSGAAVSLVSAGTVATVAGGPFTDVEAFGVLLRQDVNYSCGDALQFVVRSSSVSRSGYETIAFFRRASQ
jgi:hypothetical protein